jgi:hypothetical protein
MARGTDSRPTKEITMAKHEDDPQRVNLTVDELEALLTRVASAARAEVTPAQKPLLEGLTPDEQFELMIKNDRPVAIPVTRIPCISRVEYGGTGAHFIARVQPATVRSGRKIPDRVVDLEHYEKPDGYDRPASEKNPFGLADGYGAPINGGLLEPRTKHYIYERFYLADLRAVVGRALNPAYPMTPEEIATYYPSGLTAQAAE